MLKVGAWGGRDRKLKHRIYKLDVLHLDRLLFENDTAVNEAYVLKGNPIGEFNDLVRNYPRHGELRISGVRTRWRNVGGCEGRTCKPQKLKYCGPVIRASLIDDLQLLSDLAENGFAGRNFPWGLFCNLAKRRQVLSELLSIQTGNLLQNFSGRLRGLQRAQ